MLEELLLNLARAISIQIPILISGIFFIVSIRKNWLDALNKPIDFGTGLFGPNKNWRGVFFYVLGGAVFTYPMHLLAVTYDWVAPVFKNDWLVLGLAMGLAYSGGELVNSFIKRRLGVAAGALPSSRAGRLVQAFFDNADGALAVGQVLTWVFHAEQTYLWIALFISLGIHAGTDIWMRKLKLKKSKH